MIDTNVYLSRWPFRRLPWDETGRLVEKLQSLGVASAWAGSFDAVLHRDVGGVNARLAAECRDHGGLLVPFGCVNLVLPDWRDDVRRCAEQYGMPGLRLHPNYHGYDLNDARFAELLDLAGEKRLIVQLAVTMEDDRTQHPLVQVPGVDVAPLESLLKARSKLPVVLLNAMKTVKPEAIGRLAAAGTVYVDIAMQEAVGGVETLLASVPVERVLFGSYAPFFYPESAVLKLQESEPGAHRQSLIARQNAAGLLT
jgi:predicted TIM-barrel fold metal-dependent hydrolase